MALVDFWITQGDDGPALVGILKDADGNALDLTGKEFTGYVWKSGAANSVIAGDGVLDTSTKGKLSVDVTGLTVDLVGLYRCSFHDTTSNIHYPNDGSFRAQVSTKPPPAPAP